MAISPKTKLIVTYYTLCCGPAVFLLSVVFTNMWLVNGENGVGLLGIGQPLYPDVTWTWQQKYTYHKRKFAFYNRYRYKYLCFIN